MKICGLAEPAGFDAAIASGADWLGFVFFAASPRAIRPARAAALSARHPGGAGRIGLFVRAGDTEIARCLEQVRLDGLQIYDTAERAAEIGARFGLPVWHACAVATASDLPVLAPGLQRLVLESRQPASSDRPGGNGHAFDWSLPRGWQAPCPWLLAGGLDPENVAAAIQASGAIAVDVSSGVERQRGVKDPARIAAFIANARAALVSGRPVT
ncbi:phosphoribosylanthranilate isomerase [Lichenicoccus sp.]|uniref:phosphoribosylanthranilate isomerase n=1 Tax=Lichenicoccus sp. TaxID=2781899 RepID=UPI003D10075A